MTLPVISAAASTEWLSVLCAFLLRVTVGYAFCAVIAKLARSAPIRFLLWASFLFSTAAYWIYCLAHLFSSPVASIAVASTAVSAPVANAAAGHPWVLSVQAAERIGIVLPFAALLYIATLLALAFAGAVKRIQLTRALRFRMPPDQAAVTTFRRISEQLQAPPCDLYLLPGLTSPASLGWAKPAIYLPVEEAGAAADLDDVLRHELSHVRRRDALWESLARLCRWFVFFHPAVHKAFSSLRLEREFACDMLVVRLNPAQRDLYAHTLVRFGWKTAAAPAADHVGIGFTSQSAVLNARVKAILQGERVYSKWSRGLRVLLGSGACWTFAAVLPTLWIAFGLPFLPPPATAFISSTSRTSPPKHRRTALTASLNPSTPPSPALAEASNPITQTTHRRDPSQAFHVQNEDEPMSNPSADIAGADAGNNGTSTGGGTSSAKANLPSAKSVLVNTATQLARTALSHHDHDHD